MQIEGLKIGKLKIYIRKLLFEIRSILILKNPLFFQIPNF